MSSPFSPGEVIDRPRSNVEPSDWLRFANAQKPFTGSVEDRSFRITRVLSYRNSFQPWIRGRVDEFALGSTVTITMTLHPFVSVFITLWLGFTFVAGVPQVTELWRDGALNHDVAIPLGMFAVGLAMMLGGFYFEAPRAERALLALVSP